MARNTSQDQAVSSSKISRLISNIQNDKTQSIINFKQRPIQVSQTRLLSDNFAKAGKTKINWQLTQEVLDVEKEFKLEKVLGKGNSSVVHRAFDLKLGTTVAVKIIEKTSMKETYLREMLQREIDVQILLDHPNLAKLLRVMQDSSRVYIVQEYCGTKTLSQFAEAKKVTENRARQIFKQIIAGVAYLHKLGFSHRDLKFSNVLLNEFGTVKIVDFGFVCDARRKQNIFCGTPSYMPPEMIRRRDYMAGPVDMWSLGVVLYKLVTHNYPFGACNDKDLDKKIEQMKYNYPQSVRVEIRGLIDGMLQYQPDDRLTADEVQANEWLQTPQLNNGSTSNNQQQASRIM